MEGPLPLTFAAKRWAEDATDSAWGGFPRMCCITGATPMQGEVGFPDLHRPDERLIQVAPVVARVAPKGQTLFNQVLQHVRLFGRTWRGTAAAALDSTASLDAVFAQPLILRSVPKHCCEFAQVTACFGKCGEGVKKRGPPAARAIYWRVCHGALFGGNSSAYARPQQEQPLEPTRAANGKGMFGISSGTRQHISSPVPRIVFRSPNALTNWYMLRLHSSGTKRLNLMRSHGGCERMREGGTCLKSHSANDARWLRPRTSSESRYPTRPSKHSTASL